MEQLGGDDGLDGAGEPGAVHAEARQRAGGGDDRGGPEQGLLVGGLKVPVVHQPVAVGTGGAQDVRHPGPQRGQVGGDPAGLQVVGVDHLAVVRADHPGGGAGEPGDGRVGLRDVAHRGRRRGERHDGDGGRRGRTGDPVRVGDLEGVGHHVHLVAPADEGPGQQRRPDGDTALGGREFHDETDAHVSSRRGGGR